MHKAPHFSQTFIIRGRLRITRAQISSPPHLHVPMDWRIAAWRATFCTLLSLAMVLSSLLLDLLLVRCRVAPLFLSSSSTDLAGEKTQLGLPVFRSCLFSLTLGGRLAAPELA